MRRRSLILAMLAGLGGCATPDAQQGAKPFGQAAVGKEVPGVVGPEGGVVVAVGNVVATTVVAVATVLTVEPAGVSVGLSPPPHAPANTRPA